MGCVCTQALHVAFSRKGKDKVYVQVRASNRAAHALKPSSAGHNLLQSHPYLPAILDPSTLAQPD